MMIKIEDDTSRSDNSASWWMLDTALGAMRPDTE